MSALAAVDRTAKAKAAPAPHRRQKETGRTIVSASRLAAHLDVARGYLDKLLTDGVIGRLPDGRYDQDICRVRVLRHLRRERKASAGNAAQMAHTEAKTALLRQRLAEREGKLVPVEVYDAMIDDLCGTFLTALGEMPAMIAARDIPLRRRIEQAVYEVRRRVADCALDKAKACEPHRSGSGSE